MNKYWLVAALIVAFLLGGCAPAQTAMPTVAPTAAVAAKPTAVPAPVNPVLNVGIVADPPAGLDPHFATSQEYQVISQVYEALVTNPYDDPGQVKPLLAKSWDVSADGLTFTFHLREGVKFHDGTSFDADAVKNNVERILRDKTGPYWAINTIKSIRVVDPLTVEFTKDAGGPSFLRAMLLVRFVSPKAIKDNAGTDDAHAWLSENAVGTGPYVLTSFRHGDSIVVKRWADYWGGWSPDQFTEVDFRIIPDPAVQSLMIGKGDLDIAYVVPRTELASLGSQQGVKVIIEQGNNALNVRLNTAAGPTKDIRVRQALEYAFDYEGYIKVMTGKYARQYGPVPPQYISGWKPDFPWTYDPAKAKQLLAEAGYTQANKAKLLIVVNAEQDQTEMVTMLKSGVEGTGLAELTPEVQSGGALLARDSAWGTTHDPKDVVNMYALWTNARIPEPYAYLWYLYATAAQSGSGRNWIWYSNPKVDEAISKASQSQDAGEQAKQYQAAVQTVVNDATDINCGVQAAIYVVRADITGFHGDPNWYPSVRAYDLRHAAK